MLPQYGEEGQRQRLLLCKSFCKVSASIAKQQDLPKFVGDAADSMSVCFVRVFVGKDSESSVYVKGLRFMDNIFHGIRLLFQQETGKIDKNR